MYGFTNWLVHKYQLSHHPFFTAFYQLIVGYYQ